LSGYFGFGLYAQIVPATVIVTVLLTLAVSTFLVSEFFRFSTVFL
jgi:hypothetical protein